MYKRIRIKLIIILLSYTRLQYLTTTIYCLLKFCVDNKITIFIRICFMHKRVKKKIRSN